MRLYLVLRNLYSGAIAVLRLFSNNGFGLSSSLFSHTFDSLGSLFNSLGSNFLDSWLSGGGVFSSGVTVASNE